MAATNMIMMMMLTGVAAAESLSGGDPTYTDEALGSIGNRTEVFVFISSVFAAALSLAVWCAYAAEKPEKKPEPELELTVYQGLYMGHCY
jgi:hypothetical protein